MIRDIHIAHLDKARPVLVLTRDPVPCAMRRVTVAPITSTAKGLSTEVPLGPANGLDQTCVVSCDHIITIDKAALGRQVGFLLERQEPELTAAIMNAFALRAGGTSTSVSSPRGRTWCSPTPRATSSA